MLGTLANAGHATSTVNQKVGLGEGGVGVVLSTPVDPQTWLRSARNFAKTRFRQSPSFQFSAKKIFFDVIFRPRDICFAFLSQFWRLDMQTDLRIECLAIFRSRWTYYELCTTKKLAKIARLRLGSPPNPPCPQPHQCVQCKEDSTGQKNSRRR